MDNHIVSMKTPGLAVPGGGEHRAPEYVHVTERREEKREQVDAEHRKRGKRGSKLCRGVVC